MDVFSFRGECHRRFLPIHIRRLNDLLDQIADVQDADYENDDEKEIDSRASGSRGRSAYSRAPSPHHRGLHAELRSMIQNLQRQLREQSEEQQVREEKHLAQMEQQRSREETLLDQLFTRLEHSFDMAPVETIRT